MRRIFRRNLYKEQNMIKVKTRLLPPCSTALLPQGDGYISVEEIISFQRFNLRAEGPYEQRKPKQLFSKMKPSPWGRSCEAGEGALFFPFETRGGASKRHRRCRTLSIPRTSLRSQVLGVYDTRPFAESAARRAQRTPWWRRPERLSERSELRGGQRPWHVLCRMEHLGGRPFFRRFLRAGPGRNRHRA